MISENKYRTIAVTATPFIILGGICIGLGWRYVSRAWNRKPKPKLARSMAFSALHGGKLAFERLVDYHNFGGKSTNTDADMKKLEELLADEHPRFKEIQVCNLVLIIPTHQFHTLMPSVLSAFVLEACSCEAGNEQKRRWNHGSVE